MWGGRPRAKYSRKRRCARFIRTAREVWKCHSEMELDLWDRELGLVVDWDVDWVVVAWRATGLERGRGAHASVPRVVPGRSTRWESPAIL